ncbi:syntaxin-binding protein 6 isoform 1-T4 [Menidia menidia]
MSAKSAINKEIFTPHDEKMLAAVQVKRRTKKKIPFLATGGQGDYMTFICISVTNRKPSSVSITKVKQFQGSSAFVKRSQWTVDQLRQVNGIDPNKDCPEFDLTFDNALDQWVASSAGEKCIFIQILHHTCQRHCSAQKPEFVNCQSKLLGEAQEVHSVIFRCKVFLNRMKKELVSRHGHLLRQGNSILHSAADSVTSAVQKASQALNERGERLGRTEERTAEMMNSAEQFAVTAHKLAMKHKC